MLVIVEPPKVVIPDPRPGQLWKWDFDYKAAGEEGWWFATRVTSEGRHLPTFAIVILKRGDQLLCVSLDDPGPYQIPKALGHQDEFGVWHFDDPPPAKRYHVFMKGDTLIWFEHDWLDQCKLIADAE